MATFTEYHPLIIKIYFEPLSVAGPRKGSQINTEVSSGGFGEGFVQNLIILTFYTLLCLGLFNYHGLDWFAMTGTIGLITEVN